MNGDHDIHEPCGYENARCACPKGVNPPSDPELRAQLASKVLEAVRAKRAAKLDNSNELG